jgi:quinohemoprotein ethanol dehydrogenase
MMTSTGHFFRGFSRRTVMLSAIGTISALFSFSPLATAQELADVNGKRIVEAEKFPQEWLSHGRTYAEQRYSPLDQVDADSVSRLGLAWSFELPTRRGVEATPLVADGVMYTTGSWSIVYALDARSGALFWTYDPEVPKEHAMHACCDVVNRGVALWGDKVYLGSLDGRLIAIDRATGKQAWSTDTIIDRSISYTITGAPRVVKGLVIIGNGGAEMGVRGYVSAYDAQTGDLVWRFFTVPGNPAKGFEDKTQQWIASTWTGEWWKSGGGGTAWDSFAYDPELNLLYIGVGNGSPWNRKVRSPGGGDNLFLSSIVAVNADDGSYVWHYQTTPGDSWDFTATQQMTLAELEIGGRTRKVIMQAPKNGFFYVLDRRTGELLSADPFAKVNWATHIDMQTGRPVEDPRARSGSDDFTVYPGSGGAHNWMSMAYSPDTGLVYIPARDSGHVYVDDFIFEARKTIYNINYDISAAVNIPDWLPVWARNLVARWKLRSRLVAWDPLARREAWSVDSGVLSAGGVLATGGNLVFQGNLTGEFAAYAADTGDKVWSYKVENGILAAPISYEIDGEQYIAVMQGWGGGAGLSGGVLVGPMGIFNISRVLVFRLGGSEPLPQVAGITQELPEPTLPAPPQDRVEQGRKLYTVYCLACHGIQAISGAVVPDLRYRTSDLDAAWKTIVIDGGLKTNGMPGWNGYLTVDEANLIKDYVLHEAIQGHRRGESRTVRK